MKVCDCWFARFRLRFTDWIAIVLWLFGVFWDSKGWFDCAGDGILSTGFPDCGIRFSFCGTFILLSRIKLEMNPMSASKLCGV